MYKKSPSTRRRKDALDTEASEHLLGTHLPDIRKPRKYPARLVLITMGVATVLAGLCLLVLAGADSQSALHNHSCDTVFAGYECEPQISHFWGQYSPFSSVPSQIKDQLPPTCHVDQASILSRHGARDPTASKSKTYAVLVNKIKTGARSFQGKYAFLKDYNYTLGADQLTVFGQQQMVNSGVKFYARYESLARSNAPFVRASGEQRVIDSAVNWTQGLVHARKQDRRAEEPKQSYPMLVIPETEGTNNTLNHGLCTAFEEGSASTTADKAQAQFASIFTPPISQRLNNDLPGANLSQSDVVDLMSICPFETVASSTGKISDFCRLFSEDEWHAYDYYQSIGKYYGYGAGNELGPTQGVGFANELLARLTGRPVKDSTSTNRTLDQNRQTFPLDQALYADFGHDNDMTGVFFALGLYNQTAHLSNTTVTSVSKAKGYSSSWTVPFAARVYFERIKCQQRHKDSLEYVRVLVNDRVVPLQSCTANKQGMCLLQEFVNSQGFAVSNGRWNTCFV